jgi:hypothetical protein
MILLLAAACRRYRASTKTLNNGALRCNALSHFTLLFRISADSF